MLKRAAFVETLIGVLAFVTFPKLSFVFTVYKYCRSILVLKSMYCSLFIQPELFLIPLSSAEVNSY
jgi:hypothetical protein